MNQIRQTKCNAANHSSTANAWLASCQKIIDGVERTREAILAEFRQTLGAHEHLLRLVLNEAEVLAWQTEVPHLVFPALAMEKAQSVAAWHARQESLQRTHFKSAVAAD